MLAAALLCMASGAAAVPSSVTIVVDPRAADRSTRIVQQSGRLGPVATIAQALDLTRELRARNNRARIRIEIAPGTHRLEKPVRLGPEHSGTAEAPLVLAGASDGSSRIVGSVPLRPAGPVTQVRFKARTDVAARANIRTYHLPAAALATQRIEPPRRLNQPIGPLGFEIYDEAGALVPARWPNEGWARVEQGDGLQSFRPSGGRPRMWSEDPDLWAEGFWRWDWLLEAFPVQGIDPERGTLRLQSPPFEGILPNARVRVYHALAELDAPGEWWRDLSEGLVLVWPRSGHNEIEAAVAETLLQIEGASHVRIENLRLERSRGDLVVVRGGRDVLISRSVLAWAGMRAVVFEGAIASGVAESTISDTGASAVRLVGGDRERLVSGEQFVRDTRITRFARIMRTQNPAIDVDGVGATISGNYIHDAGAYAIHLRGNEHRVERNEIARLLNDVTDSGAIYAGRDWTARGNVIRHNFVHDVRASPGFEVKGVYLDDMASGFTVESNLFLRVDQPVFIGGGRDNVIQGNIFVASSPAVHFDSRGETWARDAIEDPESELRAAFRRAPVHAALWRARYPKLAPILGDEPGVAKGNLVRGNVFVESDPFHYNQGGRPERQTIVDNRGPAGIRLSGGVDLHALAAESVRPRDFISLAPKLPLDLMQRSVVLEDPFGR